jgi:Dihydroprymidine dehydrogenase domain II, 4Fe-4S cluster/NAD(P)-binding Rossmann-like domain
VALQPRRFQRSERRPAPGPPRPPRDITPLPDLLHGQSRAGPVRTGRPVYVDLFSPCNSACPAGENIQGYLAQVQVGEHERAWRILVADNPFAAIHGRVCYHRCETSCNRAQLDSAVSIHAVERFLGDMALEQGWLFDPPRVRSGKRVLVIGAGPSGLSAACHLARLGHEVEVRDAGEDPGGMMRYGIPAYRLPRYVLGGGIVGCQLLVGSPAQVGCLLGQVEQPLGLGGIGIGQGPEAQLALAVVGQAHPQLRGVKQEPVAAGRARDGAATVLKKRCVAGSCRVSATPRFVQQTELGCVAP